MSHYRRQVTRTDAAQPAIVDALRKAGAKVYLIGRPCDLLTLYGGRWLPLEVKTPGKNRKDQEAQEAFLSETGVPKVRTPEEALRAVGVTERITRMVAYPLVDIRPTACKCEGWINGQWRTICPQWTDDGAGDSNCAVCEHNRECHAPDLRQQSGVKTGGGF